MDREYPITEKHIELLCVLRYTYCKNIGLNYVDRKPINLCALYRVSIYIACILCKDISITL